MTPDTARWWLEVASSGRRRHSNIGHARPIVLALVLVLALLTLSYKTPVTKEPRDILAYTVRIFAKEEGVVRPFGTGTVIGHATYEVGGDRVTHSLVLTNEHVVRGREEITTYSRGVPFGGTVVSVDPDRDLALVEVRGTLPKAPLYFGPLEPGEREVIVGDPFGHGLLITEGFVGNAISGVRAGSASAYPGNSGGGLYVDRADRYVLAGVVGTIQKYPNGLFSVSLASTVHFAVPMEKVREFLREHGVLAEE